MSAPDLFSIQSGSSAPMKALRPERWSIITDDRETVFRHLIAVGVRKYAEIPAQRDAAARMILRNALRLAEAVLGRKEAAEVALEMFQEGGQ